MQRTQIYLPKQQLRALQTAAKQADTNVSAIIRAYIAERIGTQHGQTSKQSGISLASTAKQISKLGKAGPKDLATHIDHYLYGR